MNREPSYRNGPMTSTATATTTARRERRLDLGGLALGTIGLAALVYAVIAAGGNGTAAIAAAAVGAFALAGFVIVERRVADPLLPPGVFRRSPSRTGRRW
jgi:DHA2 family methylenomycin A resistance protein-like MFS transporter